MQANSVAPREGQLLHHDDRLGPATTELTRPSADADAPNVRFTPLQKHTAVSLDGLRRVASER